MTLGRAFGRERAIVRALLTASVMASILAFAPVAGAAPLASELGPVTQLAAPSGGFVGRMSVAPDHGPVGTPVTVSGQGLPANADIALLWRTVDGHWKVGDGEYNGREFLPVAYRIATVHTDAAGAFTASFTAPDDFGFLHDILAQQGERLL